MSKVLYIKANAKEDSQSRTFRISEAFMKEYKLNHKDDEIVELDLYKLDIGVLPFGKLGELHNSSDEVAKNHPILKYAYELKTADKVIIAAPFWNLSIPAILKAYIDYVTVNGITFKYGENGPIGLCHGKVMHITSRGGIYSIPQTADFEMGDRYLRTIFAFLGFSEFTTIACEGLDIMGNDIEKEIQEKIEIAKMESLKF